MPEVFISYSRKDKDFVANLHQALAEQQRDTWLDTKDIPPTAEWLEEIFGAIEAADTFVYVMSPDGILSEVCQQEIMHALKHHKRIIPVVRREVDTKTVPEPLAKLNWLFFREHDDFDTSFEALVKAINTDLDYVRAHTRFLTKAIDWETKGHDKGLLLRGIDLKEGESWLAQSGEKEPNPTPLQVKYILASRQAAVSRQRTLLGAVTLGLVVAVGLAALAFYQYQVADKRGRIALSRQLAAQSTSLPAQNDRSDLHDLRLLLSTYAFEMFETSEAKSALAKNLLSNPRLISYMGDLKGFAFSPDGKNYACIKKASIIIVDLLTHQPKHVFPISRQEDEESQPVIFSPDSKLIASQVNQEIIIWDVDSGKRLNENKIASGAMAWWSQAKTLLGVARQNTIDLFDADGRVEMSLPLPPGMGEIKSLNCRRDAKIIAALDAKQQVFLWDAFDKTSSVIHIPKANTLVFTPKGDLMGVKIGETETRSDKGALEIPIIKVSTSKPELSVMQIPAKRFISGASPDGRYLALEGDSGKGGNALFIWDMQNRRFLDLVLETPSFYPAHRGEVWAAFSSDGKLMASHSHLNDNIYLWDLNENQMFCREIKGITGDIADLKLALDNDGKVLVSLDSRNNLVFWDVATRKALDIKKNLPGNLKVKDIIFTPDSRLIAVVATKETAEKLSCRLWDVQEAKFISPVIEAKYRYRSLSKDGQVLVATGDNDISLWNVRTQEMVDLIKPDRYITGVSLSPDKKLLALTWKRGSVIELWDVAQKKLLEPLRSAGSDLICFSPDGKTLVDPGNGLTFWDMATRQSWTIPVEDDIWTLTFSGNGKLLAVVGTKGEAPESKIGVIKLYNLDSSSWPGMACRIANRNLSREEWRQYLGDLPYRPICQGLPVREDEQAMTEEAKETRK